MTDELKAAVERANRIAIDEYGRSGGSLHQRIIRALADEPEVITDLLSHSDAACHPIDMRDFLQRLAEIVK